MKEITEEQFWQLVGLITAGRNCRKTEDSLEKAYCQITGEEFHNSRYTDYVWEDDDIESGLREYLPHDGVIVKKGEED